MKKLAVEKNGKVYMSLQGLKGFREAGLTKKHNDGTEHLYFNNAEQDPDGVRCYAVIDKDMRFNDIVCMTKNQMLLAALKFGDQLEIADWTEKYNIQPFMLDEFEGEKYGVPTTKRMSFDELMLLGTKKSI